MALGIPHFKNLPISDHYCPVDDPMVKPPTQWIMGTPQVAIPEFQPSRPPLFTSAAINLGIHSLSFHWQQGRHFSLTTCIYSTPTVHWTVLNAWYLYIYIHLLFADLCFGLSRSRYPQHPRCSMCISAATTCAAPGGSIARAFKGLDRETESGHISAGNLVFRSV